MHRCYTDKPAAVGQTVLLSPDESAHIARVMRLKKGDNVELIGGERKFAGVISHIGKDGVSVLATLELPSPEPRARLTLYQGLPKADKLDLIAQKATELGVWRVVPVVMDRCVARDLSLRSVRLNRIALEAAKQAGRAHVPEVAAAISVDDMCALIPSHGLCAVAWEEESALRLSDAIKSKGDIADIAFVIGPEGGITASEAQKMTAAGAVCASLGPRILRTETAGLCCLSAALIITGEM